MRMAVVAGGTRAEPRTRPGIGFGPGFFPAEPGPLPGG